VYDYIDAETGIRVSKYGAHLFHTNDEGVWNYVNKFSAWSRWDHRVVADLSNCYVPIPVNINTVNSVFNLTISDSAEMDIWLKNERVDLSGAPVNSEEVALSRVGSRLYNTFFKEYTVKQWAKEPRDLEPSVLERIPVRNNFDDRYFSDKFQGLPLNGYTSLVEKMLDHPNIKVQLNTDWSSFKEKFWSELIFTGPIDVFFKEAGLPALEYRSIDFEWSRIKCNGFYQPNSVVNYPSSLVKETRCVEYKHFLNQKSEWTIIAKETTSDSGEPYYPVPTSRNRDLYLKYKEMASSATGVHFVGRLASYKYFNMDQAIRNALDYFTNVLDPVLNKLKIDTPSIIISELNNDGLDEGTAGTTGKGVSTDEGRDISALEA
jgi:UDP-galactopyranose mutase